MTDTMLRLQNLASTTIPKQTIDRVWSELAANATPTLSRPRQRVLPPRPIWRVLDSRPISALATAALLALVLLSGYFSINGNHAVAPTAIAPSEDVGYRLLAKGVSVSAVQELNPLTLADAQNGLSYPFASLASPTADPVDYLVDRWYASSDGTRLIGWIQQDYYRNHSAILVVDPITGTQLRHIPIASGSSEVRLNADGSRVAVEIDGGTFESVPAIVITRNPVRWDIYDTATGQLLTQIESQNDRDPVLSGSGWFDPSGRLFYRFSVDRTIVDSGPWPVQLVVDDAETGLERERLDLPSVLMGSWLSNNAASSTSCGQLSDPDESGMVLRSERAEVAISPDGTTMAIPHPDGKAVTLIDLKSFQIGRMLTLPATAISAPTAATPIADSDLPCPSETNYIRDTWFSPDGTSLYVMGLESLAGDQAQASAYWASSPMLRIDVAAGTVEASVTADGGDSTLLWPLLDLSPDGRNIYTVRYSISGLYATIERRDAKTLAVLATREYANLDIIIVTAK